MPKTVAVLAVCSALALALPAVAAAQRTNPRMMQGGESIDEMIADYMEEHDVPGMALAIVQAPYIPRVTGYGVADRERGLLVSSNTLFDVGAMADAYTAVAVMQLVERGRLSLDDPIGKHVDALPQAWRAVTLRQLLLHGSGIPDYARAPGHDPARRSEPRALLALAASLPPRFAPGADVANSATDYLLLALAVEAASGERYRAFVRANQFDRLGLRHTVFADERGRVRREAVEENGDRHRRFLEDPALINPTEPATGYRAAGEELRPVSAAQPYPASGPAPILASAMDVSLWDVGLAGGILVADPALRAILYQPATLADGRKVSVAGAWRFPGRPGLMYVTGSANGQTAFLSRFSHASELVCVTLLANREGLDLTQLARRIAGAYDPRLGPPALAAEMRVQQSPFPARETIERLERALRAEGLGVVTRGGDPGGMAGLALELRPDGGPGGLPVRAVAWEEEGQVWVGHTDPAAVVGGAGTGDRGREARALRARLDRVVLSVVTPY